MAHTVHYSEGNDYLVKVEGRIVATFLTKSDAIYYTQLKNGWPADGNEQTYSQQAAEAEKAKKPKKPKKPKSPAMTKTIYQLTILHPTNEYPNLKGWDLIEALDKAKDEDWPYAMGSVYTGNIDPDFLKEACDSVGCGEWMDQYE